MSHCLTWHRTSLPSGNVNSTKWYYFLTNYSLPVIKIYSVLRFITLWTRSRYHKEHVIILFLIMYFWTTPALDAAQMKKLVSARIISSNYLIKVLNLWLDLYLKRIVLTCCYLTCCHLILQNDASSLLGW